MLEPQPFSSYGKSVRFSDKLKDNYAQLLKDGPWKDEDGDFERVLLEEIGFERREKLGATGRDGGSSYSGLWLKKTEDLVNRVPKAGRCVLQARGKLGMSRSL